MRIKLLVAALLLPFAMPASAALAPGVRAPDFVAPAALNGKAYRIDLAQLRRKGPVVLYFFPAAFTPGCNAEAAAFAAAVDDFKAAGASVVGISADSVDRLKSFSAEHCAGKFPVASADSALIRKYDVALGRQLEGREISNRTSYVIAPDGRILHAYTDMKPAEHVRQTLKIVREWRASKRR